MYIHSREINLENWLCWEKESVKSNLSKVDDDNQREGVKHFRHLEVDWLASVNDAVGDGCAVDDAPEDVDQQGLHVVVLGDDAESLLHLERNGGK